MPNHRKIVAAEATIVEDARTIGTEFARDGRRRISSIVAATSAKPSRILAASL